MLWEGYVVAEDICECLIPAFAFEGGGAEQHFVDEDSEGPPVDCACVAAAFDDFGGYVLFCAYEGIGSEIRYT